MCVKLVISKNHKADHNPQIVPLRLNDPVPPFHLMPSWDGYGQLYLFHTVFIIMVAETNIYTGLF
jgi:hypothetical protein